MKMWSPFDQLWAAEVVMTQGSAFVAAVITSRASSTWASFRITRIYRLPISSI